MTSLRADVDSILEMRGTEPETAPFELTEGTVFGALLTAPIEPLPEPRGRANGYRSRCTIEGEDVYARKKDRTDLEAARRVSLID